MGANVRSNLALLSQSFERHIPARVQVLDGAAFMALRDACVYVWWRGEDCQYVGMSSQGITRPTSKAHSALRWVRSEDFIQLIYAHPTDIPDLEWWLIYLLRPKLNLQGSRRSASHWICSVPECNEIATRRITPGMREALMRPSLIRPSDTRLYAWLCDAHWPKDASSIVCTG